MLFNLSLAKHERNRDKIIVTLKKHFQFCTFNFQLKYDTDRRYNYKP